MAAAAQAQPLDGRIAIVTGASRGIGRAIALHLASLGARLVVGYSSNSTQADLLVSEINTTANSNSNSNSNSRAAVAVQVDVSDPSAVRSLFDRAESAFGEGEENNKVHILVNSAGVIDATYPTVAGTSVEEWDRTFSTNARGAFLCSREAANRLARGGRIVNITSSTVASLRTGFGSYAASKAAVEAMTRIMARELRGTGITANCVAPGPIATDMFYDGKDEEMVRKVVEECPLGRLGVAGDVAPVVGFLATEAGGWVNGQVVRVNGGYV